MPAIQLSGLRLQVCGVSGSSPDSLIQHRHIKALITGSLMSVNGEGIRSLPQRFPERVGYIVHDVTVVAITQAENFLTIDETLGGTTAQNDDCA